MRSQLSPNDLVIYANRSSIGKMKTDNQNFKDYFEGIWIKKSD